LFYLKTLNGEKYFKSDDGSIWRIYNFVEKSISFDETNSCDIIYQVGKAYGNFFFKLQNFDAHKLKITIPNFHNTKMRYNILDEAVMNNPERASLIQREYALLKKLKNHACFLDSLIDDKKLPLRITHNDTKCNNVLFNRLTLSYITVIDLDTIMPGYVAHDFGDGARSICSTEREDSKNFEKVSFDLNKYYYYAKGFSEELSSSLNELEKVTIHLGILKITTELSMRFLTDFLCGDVYFKIDYKNHNLNRAINQLTLAYDILDKQEDIREITRSLLK
jgi:thiamine kinase-like enzyme